MNKLIMSKTEQDFRRDLINSKKGLFDEDGDKRLLTILKDLFPNMVTAYTIDWLPDQGEEIYEILVDDHTIVKIELDRYDLTVKPIVEVIPLKQYTRGIKKQRQIQLAVALDLAKNDLEEMQKILKTYD